MSKMEIKNTKCTRRPASMKTGIPGMATAGRQGKVQHWEGVRKTKLGRWDLPELIFISFVIEQEYHKQSLYPGCLTSLCFKQVFSPKLWSKVTVWLIQTFRQLLRPSNLSLVFSKDRWIKPVCLIYSTVFVTTSMTEDSDNISTNPLPSAGWWHDSIKACSGKHKPKTARESRPKLPSKVTFPKFTINSWSTILPINRKLLLKQQRRSVECRTPLLF